MFLWDWMVVGPGGTETSIYKAQTGILTLWTKTFSWISWFLFQVFGYSDGKLMNNHPLTCSKEIKLMTCWLGENCGYETQTLMEQREGFRAIILQPAVYRLARVRRFLAFRLGSQPLFCTSSLTSLREVHEEKTRPASIKPCGGVWVLASQTEALRGKHGLVCRQWEVWFTWKPTTNYQ